MNVAVYVNGKRVTKEEIGKIEVHNDNVKAVLSKYLKK